MSQAASARSSARQSAVPNIVCSPERGSSAIWRRCARGPVRPGARHPGPLQPRRPIPLERLRPHDHGEEQNRLPAVATPAALSRRGTCASACSNVKDSITSSRSGRRPALLTGVQCGCRGDELAGTGPSLVIDGVGHLEITRRPVFALQHAAQPLALRLRTSPGVEPGHQRRAEFLPASISTV